MFDGRPPVPVLRLVYRCCPPCCFWSQSFVTFSVVGTDVEGGGGGGGDNNPRFPFQSNTEEPVRKEVAVWSMLVLDIPLHLLCPFFDETLGRKSSSLRLDDLFFLFLPILGIEEERREDARAATDCLEHPDKNESARHTLSLFG